MDEDHRLATARSSVAEIYETLGTNSSAWQFSLPMARGAMSALDVTMYMRRKDELEDQIWFINGIQKLAYHEPEAGAVSDISEWCLGSWLVVLQNHPENVEVLKGVMAKIWIAAPLVDCIPGMGQNWLLKAQAALARIQQHDVSSSSSGASTNRSITLPLLELARSEDEQEVNRQAAEAEARLGLPDYLEARGMLIPATEHFANAVESARRQDTVSGELLSLVGWPKHVFFLQDTANLGEKL